MFVNDIKKGLLPIYHYMFRGIPKGYIFMLHRVGEDEPGRLGVNENLKVSPEFLDSFLNKYKRDYKFIDIHEIPEYLGASSSQRFMCFTMDDGYKDNYTIASAIFRKHQAPFTIFVSTDFPDNKAVLWWYELEEILLSQDYIKLNNGMEFDISSKDKKEQAFMTIRRLILAMDQTKLIHELNNLFGQGIDWTSKCKSLAMTWDDIKKCKEDSLITIGGHTQHHYNLKQLASKNEVIDEITNGMTIMKEKAGIEVDVFAYPFGTKNEVSGREINAASQIGFRVACIAGKGYCGSKNVRSLYALPRLMLTNEFREKDLR